MEEKEWLESLKVGDKVAVSHDYGHKYFISEIAKLTNTQFVLTGEQRFYRRNGREVTSEKWNVESIEQITPQVVEWIKREKIKTASWIKLGNELPLDKIERILNILREK